MGRAASSLTVVDEIPLLLGFHPSSFLAGRPLLLHSCPLSAAVAGALLLLSAQGKEQRSYWGWPGGVAIFQDTEAVSLPSLPQGCPGLHQHLQHAPDVLPDAGTATAMAHQPHGLCEKRQHYPRLPPPISQHPQPLPSIEANCPGPTICSSPPPTATSLPPNPITQTQGGGWGFPAESILSLPPVILSTFSWAIPSYHLPWQAPRPWTSFPSSDGLAFHSQPCPAGCMDGHMGGRSDPERGPRPGRRCGLLHDDCDLPYPEVRVEMSQEAQWGKNRCLGGLSSQARLGI